MMSLHTMPAGTKGFDCNTPLSYEQAQAARGHGYQFVFRYVGRQSTASHDLSEHEAAGILSAGLGLVLVQHVESAESWAPDPSKGAYYGAFAANAAHELKLPPNTPIWCDLEGVNTAIPDRDVIGYCNEWFKSAKAGGADPGLYVGWRAGLNSTQLYQNLKFPRYWSAYNLNRDQYPAVRGVQMRQLVASPSDRPAGFSFEIDVDVVQADKLGSLPTCVAQGSWGTLVT